MNETEIKKRPVAADIFDSTAAGRALLTAADAAAQRSALALDARPQVVFIGDSIMTVPVAPGDIPSAIAAALPGYDVVNKAALGETAAQTLSRYSAAGGAKSYFSAARSKNILVINTGSNTLDAGTAQDVLDVVAAIYADWTGLGGFAIVDPIFPRGDYSGPAETRRGSFNTSVASIYALAHRLTATSDTHFDSQADTSNATYFNVDTVHLAAAGVTLVAGTYLQPLIEAVPITGGTLGDMAGQSSANVHITGGTAALASCAVTGAVTAATMAATSMRATSVGFAAYPTEGYRFTSGGALSGGMVEITNGGIEYVIFYSSNANSSFFWKSSDGTDRMNLSNTGQLTAGSLASTKVVTPGGTTGAQTINTQDGTVNFAASATSLAVTNSLSLTTRPVLAMIQTNDSTAVLKNVVPGNGSFTIRMATAPTAETVVAFHILL